MEFPALVWHLAGWTDDLVKQQSAGTPWLQKLELLLAPTALGWHSGTLSTSAAVPPRILRKSSCEESESGTVNLGDPLTWL